MSDIATLSIKVDSSDVKGATQAMGGLTNAGGMVEGMVAKLAAAFAAWQIAGLIKESTLLAARYETLGVVMGVMGNNAGYTATQMAQFQQGLEATGISMVGARQSLNMMAAAQLDLSKSSELARVAQDAAKIAGTNSTEAFEALTRSIQTGMVVIAHRAGIMVSYEKAEREFAATLGKTKEQLTNQQLAHARLNAILEEGRKRQGVYAASFETTGGQLKSMERYVENLKVQFGNLFNPTLNAAVTALTGELKGTSAELTKLQASGDMQIWGMKIRDGFVTGSKVISETTRFMWEHRDAILALAAAYAVLKLIPMVNAWNLALSGWLANLTRVVPAQTVYNATLMTYTTTVEASTMATRAQAAASGLASNAISALTSPIGILIGLLVAGAAAWYYFKDATSGSSKDAVQAANERIEEATRKLKAIQRAQEAIKGGDKSSDAGWLADDEWQVRKLTTAYGEAQSAVEKYRAAHERYVSAQGSKSVGSGTFAAAPSVDIGTARDELQFQNAQKHLQETLVARQKLVDVLNKEHTATSALEQARIANGKNNIKTPVDTKYTDREYDRLNESLQKQLYLLKYGEEAAFAHDLQIKKNRDGTAAFTAAQQEHLKATKAEIIAEQDAQKLRDAIWETQQGNYRKEMDILNQYGQAKNEFMFAELDAAQKNEDENKKVAASLAMVSKLYDDGSITQRQYTDRVVDLNKQLHLETGIFGDLRDTIQDWSKSSTDAFVEFCFTGKNSFGDLINSMLRDLARLAVQKEVMGPIWGYISGGISAWAGGGSGGGESVNVTGSTWWQDIASGYANGGNPPVGIPYLVGENGPELRVDRTPGTIIPNSALGGQQVVNHISVTVQEGKVSTSSQSSDQKGNNIAKDLEGIMNQWAAKHMRKGGMLEGARA